MADWNRNDPLERVAGESKRANAALSDYAFMGAVRSLRNLLKTYRERTGAPTTSWNTLSAWSADFDWVQRANRFDELQREKDQAIFEARRRQIMESGLALTHERLEKLYQIFTQLENNLRDPDAVWVPDVKSVGQGENATRVDIVRFNSALFEQARGTLDDIAREVGGRVKIEKIDSSVVNLNVNADDLAKARQAANHYEKGLLDDRGSAEIKPGTN